jgi:hypothetical protein
MAKGWSKAEEKKDDEPEGVEQGKTEEPPNLGHTASLRFVRLPIARELSAYIGTRFPALKHA